jgi:hypothetical protein
VGQGPCWHSWEWAGRCSCKYGSYSWPFCIVSSCVLIYTCFALFLLSQVLGTGLDRIAALAVEGKGHHLASTRVDLSPVPWVASCSCCTAVVLTLIRLDRVGVQSDIYRFGMADTPMCCIVGWMILWRISPGMYAVPPGASVADHCCWAMGVHHLTVKILLGEGNFCRKIQHAIKRATITYLTQTSCLTSL